MITNGNVGSGLDPGEWAGGGDGEEKHCSRKNGDIKIRPGVWLIVMYQYIGVLIVTNKANIRCE